MISSFSPHSLNTLSGQNKQIMSIWHSEIFHILPFLPTSSSLSILPLHPTPIPTSVPPSFRILWGILGIYLILFLHFSFFLSTFYLLATPFLDLILCTSLVEFITGFINSSSYSEPLNNKYIGKSYQMSSWQFFNEFYTISRKFQYLRK